MIATHVSVPKIIRGRQYAELMSLHYETVRHQASRGTCEVPPCMVRPYRWRAEDVKRHLESVTASADRRAKDRRAAAIAKDRRTLELVKQHA